MDANPVLKPKIATPALILSSGAVSMCVAYFAGIVAASGQPSPLLILATVASLALSAIVGAVWLARVRRLRSWTTAAQERWAHFDGERRTHRTTTEITVLSVDSLEPTGSWITIRWNQFDHIQCAWIEALRYPIWPGSVLLISPDPSQVRPGVPWPAKYYIQASDFLAWAPGIESRTRQSHKPHGQPIA